MYVCEKLAKKSEIASYDYYVVDGIRASIRSTLAET